MRYTRAPAFRRGGRVGAGLGGCDMSGSTKDRSSSLRVTEIFRSLQGEGARAGMICTLVRLTGCDLRCRWCDTEYAFAGGNTMTIEEILAEVERFGSPLVEVTGGEPLLQPDAHALIAALLDADYEVMLETGGHRDISTVDPRVVRIVDFKPPGSGEDAANLWSNVDALKPGDEVKIVIADRIDYDWARRVITERRLAERSIVWLSPVHGELEPDQLAAWILEDGLPVRLQLQLHKLIWGPDAKGV